MVKLYFRSLFIILIFFISNSIQAQDVSDLKQLSLEELMNVEVSLVSRQPQKLIGAASAVQVISNESIRRSTAIRLPETLQLASNLQAVQNSAHGWAITARGFNGAPLASSSLADKLLVMIDGRTIYTPLFSGVFWDIQNVLLEDIEKIEVVSGPGGTLWGANAVNGVINIQRKSADKTQGLYVTGAVGSFTNQDAGIRYGGKISEHLSYRAYGSRSSYDNTYTSEGLNATDSWNMNQGGFRLDYDPSEKNTVTLQGDFYTGNEAGPDSSYLNGQNVLAKWMHTIDQTTNYSLQVYFDRTWRDQPGNSFSEELNTYDIDFQYAFDLGDRHQLIMGAGYRFMQDRIDTASTLIFEPADLDFNFVNIFAQDEISLIPDHLRLIIGAKLSDNYFSGPGFQPSGRIAWTPNNRQTIWAAVSRALRSAGRFDADITRPFIGKKNFDWEKVIAYEAGYRVNSSDNLSISLSAFFNTYNDLRSIDLIDSAIKLQNNQKATSWGTELSATFIASDWWKIRGGYNYLNKDIEKTSETVFDGSDSFEALDPTHQALVQSMMDLPANFSLDIIGRYVSELPPFYLGSNIITPAVPSHFSLNTRLGWTYEKLEFSVSGRNLLNKRQTEFGSLEIPRNIYGRITWRW